MSNSSNIVKCASKSFRAFVLRAAIAGVTIGGVSPLMGVSNQTDPFENPPTNPQASSETSIATEQPVSGPLDREQVPMASWVNKLGKSNTAMEAYKSNQEVDQALDDYNNKANN